MRGVRGEWTVGVGRLGLTMGWVVGAVRSGLGRVGMSDWVEMGREGRVRLGLSDRVGGGREGCALGWIVGVV